MRMSASLLLVVALTLSYCLPVSGQTPSQEPQEDVIRVRSAEVNLDVVVKDKKGRPVKDLTEKDFEIYEDGVRQQIQSFRFVMRDTPAPSTVTEPKGGNKTESAVAPARRTTPGVVALVFDRLSPEARALARKAGVAYAQQGIEAGDYTGVFGIDQSLRTFQTFTVNSESVRHAVEQATGASTSTYASSAQRMRDLADRSEPLNQEIDSATAGASSAGASHDSAGAQADAGNIATASVEQALNQMESNMLEQYEALERDQQGYATINSLLAVINPMRNLPGRKTIIFFSEGLALPPSVMMKFPSVISAANKANVSIYAIDSAGLRTESGTAESSRELNSIAAQRMQQQGRGNDRGVNGPYMKSLERNEDLLRFDPRSGLGQLADQTGGFLIHDTNDLTAGLRRINDDMRGYYLITYAPTNKDYNGRFRQISVKLNHPSYDVQARKGYYAVEPTGQFAVLDYEAPALAAAHGAGASSNPLSLRAAALSYPANSRTGLALIVAEAPLSAFAFEPSKDKKTYSADFSVVALVKDQSGQVVQKMSQHYPLSGPVERLDAAKQGSLLFYREAQLRPGDYSVELIAYDASSGKASASTSPLEIASADETKPRLSSVMVLKRAERLTADEQKRDQPFHLGELLVYPNLGEPVFKSAGKQLTFFFTAWPAKGSTNPLKVTVEIFQNHKRVGQTSSQLPAADEQGRIKYASAFPLDKFQPGVYELKVTVDDGKNSASHSTQFTVAS
jgi:VWFA-related protein